MGIVFDFESGDLPLDDVQAEGRFDPQATAACIAVSEEQRRKRGTAVASAQFDWREFAEWLWNIPNSR